MALMALCLSEVHISALLVLDLLAAFSKSSQSQMLFHLSTACSTLVHPHQDTEKPQGIVWAGPGKLVAVALEDSHLGGKKDKEERKPNYRGFISYSQSQSVFKKCKPHTSEYLGPSPKEGFWFPHEAPLKSRNSVSERIQVHGPFATSKHLVQMSCARQIRLSASANLQNFQWIFPHLRILLW